MTGAGLWPQRASYPVLVWRLALRPAGFVFGVRAAAGTSGTAGLLSNDLHVVIRMDKQVGVYQLWLLGRLESKVLNSALFEIAQPSKKRYERNSVLIARYFTK